MEKASQNVSYFIYSGMQRADRRKIESSMGLIYQPGLLIYNGSKIEFTEQNNTGVSRYGDARVVAKGDPSKMNIVRWC